MKRCICLLFSLVTAFSSIAQNVNLRLSDGIDNDFLKSKIERNASALLTEINRAQTSGTPLNTYGIDITNSAHESLSMLWANVPFYCVDNDLVERVLHTPNGYQIRNLPLEIVFKDAKLSDGTYQEAVIDFDVNGTIQSFYFAISNNLYMQVMRSTKDVTDLRRRQLILDYVEHFRTAYNQKDIDFLWQVFSDDAIIITGNVIETKRTDMNMIPKDKVKYTVQSKTSYLNRLKHVFEANTHINVNFSEIKVSRHPVKEDFYGVLLRQGYSSDRYSDDGYVFLLWDFRDENRPQIHVRTWQSYYADTDKTVAIAEEDIFDISSFDL